jgi:hypothetical protein
MNALMESHPRHMRMGRLLKGAGLTSEDAHPPGYLPLLAAARRSALAQARRQVNVREAEEDDDEEIDRGIGAQVELPPGMPMWPPRVFLAHERTYTKGWQKWLLKQGESHRSEIDPRIAEGDMLSVVVLWLDYSALTNKLALSAEDDGDLGWRGPLRRWARRIEMPHIRPFGCEWTR